MDPASVAIVTPVYPPYRGGIGKVAQLDARQLAELGAKVTVHTPGNGLTSWFRFGNAAFVPGVAGLLQRYPLVVLHYPFFGGAEFLAVAKRLAGSKSGKLVVTYHMDVVGRGPLRWFFAAHKRWCMPMILRQADRLLVTSLDYAKYGDLAGFYADGSERFRELAPSVDVERFAPGPKSAELMARYGFSADDRVIVFVGGLDKAHYFKGVPNVLKALAVKELSGVKALIVGGGSLLDSYKEIAVAMGVEKRAVFSGPVTEEELAAHYRLGDVFAFPSIDRSEAFGLAALEAMSCGLPAVASDLPGVRTIVREDETGFRVPPGSASALALALSKLLGDEALRRRLGAAGRNMAVKEYSDAARSEKWRSILAEL